MNKNFVVTDEADWYPIQPRHIDASKQSCFYDAFINKTTDLAAFIFVRYAQECHRWKSLTLAEANIAGDYSGFIHISSVLPLRSGEDELIVWSKDYEKYYYTHQFIVSCFLASPKRKVYPHSDLELELVSF